MDELKPESLVDNAPDAPRISGEQSADNDDASDFDELLDQEANGVPAKEMPVELGSAPINPLPFTRIQARTFLITPTFQPQQVLPADPNRLSLTIVVTALEDAYFALVSDDIGNVSHESTAFRIDNSLALDNLPHTGPVWVSGLGSTGDVTMSVLAVTK